MKRFPLCLLYMVLGGCSGALAVLVTNPWEQAFAVTMTSLLSFVAGVLCAEAYHGR